MFTPAHINPPSPSDYSSVADIPTASVSTQPAHIAKPDADGDKSRTNRDDLSPEKKSSRELEIRAGFQSSPAKKEPADPYKVMGDLIDLGIFEVSGFGSSSEERGVYLSQNFEEVKKDFVDSLERNAANPLLHHVMQKASLDHVGIKELIANMSMNQEKVKMLNLGDIRVIDQSPFHIRSFYSGLEDKGSFHQDTTWMNARARFMEERFVKALTQLSQRSDEQLMKLHHHPAPHFDVVGLGRGITMTKYWEFDPNKEGKSSLFIGQDNGLWKDHSQLAQTSGALEYTAETAPSNYTPDLQESFNLSRVNAHHLYQSTVHSQCINNFPGIAGEVVKIKRDPNGGWQIHISYSLENMKHEKAIHANNLLIGTGLSDARNIFYQKGQFYKEDFKSIAPDEAAQLYRLLAQAGYFQDSGKSLNKSPEYEALRKILPEKKYTDTQVSEVVQLIDDVNDGRMLSELFSKADYERLSTFDPKRGFTPIIDANTFVVSGAECSERGKGRTILAWGGGASASATMRRGLFLKDGPGVDVNPETYEARVNEVMWIAKSGIDSSRNGALPRDVIITLEEKGKLWHSCELTKFEVAGDKMLISVDRYQPVDDPESHENTVVRTISGQQRTCIRTKETLEIDQLVYALGQDSRRTEQIFDDEINITEDNIEVVKHADLQAPLHATLKSHPSIQFHGPALFAGTLSKKCVPIITDVAKSENFPPDIRPGAMPMAWALMRANHFTETNMYYKSVHATMDFQGFLDRHLLHWGVLDAEVRQGFLQDVVKNRTETRGGITTNTLHSLIEKHGLKAVLTVDNLCMLRPLKRVGDDSQMWRRKFVQ